MRHVSRITLISALLCLLSGAVIARTPVRDEPARTITLPYGASDNPAASDRARAGGLSAAALNDTAWLHIARFNGNPCNPEGWTSVDLTAQEADYFHVDDYAGLPFGPLQGSKSLWCGTRPGSDYVLCAYQTLPGYGNLWNQSWCLKSCVPVTGGPTANLDVSFSMRYHSEPSYDGTALEYTTSCASETGWTIIDGHPSYPGGWNGTATADIDSSYSVGSAPVRVRIHFTSDNSWSDEDGLYNSNGGVHIDNLQVETLALEDFEDEQVGATTSNDWESCDVQYGDFAGLFKGSDVLQEDPCYTNISCLWAFIKDSTANYACGGHPEQVAVPYVDSNNQYINNEIWSPWIELSGSGSVLNLQYDVYRDVPFDALVFYIWHVRTLVNDCPTAWRDRNFVYSGDEKAWFTETQEMGSVVSLVNVSHFQVALGVLDMCWFWCGSLGSGQCHSQGPLVDNVKVYRVDTSGPQWSVRDIDTFQDTFASNGTVTGTARVDMANDIRPSYSPSFMPGDSAVANRLMDPNYAVGTATNASGLSNDPNLSTFVGRHKTKKQAYLYAAVWPQGQPGKTGAPLSEGPGGQANRYPFSGTVVAGGVTWTKIRMDYTYTGSTTNPGIGDGTDPIVAARFNVDLNDNLFVPGDTILYFYSATSPGGTTYYSSNWRPTSAIEEVAANPMEITILPAGGQNRGGDILYVDGFDGGGVQPYYDGAFMVLGLEDLIDRYDVRAPTSSGSNRLAGRVKNIANQLNGPYRIILWDSGTSPVTLGDGTGDPDKTDDYGLLNTFLGNLTNPGGAILLGDKLPEYLADYSGQSALAFRDDYMPFTLINKNHRLAPTNFTISPNIIRWPGRAYSDDFFLFGGCPLLNDFDVMGATGTSRVEMSYNTASNANGAVLSNISAINPDAHVIMTGFSLAFVRDDEVNGESDRARFLHDSFEYLFSLTNDPTPAGPALKNSLSQNYPNPFNPQTTIAFSLKQRGAVTLRVYDVAGGLVCTLANENRAAGSHTVTWDGRNNAGQQVSSGVYFYRLVAGDFTQTKKMVLLK